MPRIKLTQSSVSAAKPKTSSYWLDDINAQKGRGCLSVKIQTSGSKSYFFSWWPTKNRKSVKIGNVPARAGLPGMTLADANERARELADLWGNGVDLKEHLQRLEADKLAQEEAKKREGSLIQLFEAYTNNMRESGKRTYQQVFANLVKETKPFFDLDRKASEFTIQHGMSILGAMIKRGAPVQSNRIRSFLMAAFTYGLHHDNDPAKNQSGTLFGLQVNPIQAIPKQKNVEKALDRNLSGKELARFLVDLDNPAYFSKQMSVYLKMMIYTGQRVEEVGRVHWSDIDLQKGLWTMAEDRSKVGASYITPLANELVKALVEHRDFASGTVVFPKANNLNEPFDHTSPAQALRKYFKKCVAVELPWDESFTSRDLRRTFKTRLGEIGISKDLRDRLQAHQLNDTSSKHYDRHDYLNEKRIAIQQWEHALECWLEDPEYDPNGLTDSSNVLSLNGAVAS